MQKKNIIIQKVLDNLKISSLNPMQVAAIDAGEQPSDIVLLSPTGTGKTLGFLLPVLLTLDLNQPGIQTLVLTPSRELALQIEQVFKQMATGFKVNCCYGGHPIKIEKNNLIQPPALLIGTPGRIADHIRRNNINVSSIRTLVLDEFDKSLELGFQEEMAFITGQLTSLSKRILTSATNAIEIPDFTGITTPKTLNYLENASPRGLAQKAVRSEGSDKLEALFRLVCKLGNEATLVFCNHRDTVERISNLLWEKGLEHGIFHGGMEQDERERELIKFRNGSHHLLITTDLASRGLDIPEIKYVIHYQLTTQEKVFLHRNGRTARMNAEGTAYLVLAEEDHLPEYLNIEPDFISLPDYPEVPEHPQWITIYIGKGKKDKISKGDIVGFVLQKGKLQKEDLGRIDVLDYTSYVAIKRTLAHQVIRLLKDEPLKKKKVKIQISK
ncbi:MAG: DEAD/DEAH box helicase [Bacteroidota bacterium]|nr:DEAD/DEAH box helicase [Bacteroidota bacterium]